jgi:hypothetical protein
MAVAGFEAMAAAYERAARAAPWAHHVSQYTFGGHTARVSVFGADLARETFRPFAHLETSVGPEPPGLTIDLWDESETGVPCPGAAASDMGTAPREVWDGTLAASPDGRHVRHEARESVTWLDRGGGRVIGYRRSGRSLFVAERAKPVLVPLLICCADWNVPVIHAGLVASGGQGVLIGGLGGAGKTTVALACLLDGLDYLADDYVGLERRAEGAFIGHSLYSTARVDSGHLARLPALVPFAIAPDAQGEKHVLPLGEFRHERLARCATIRALVLPRVVEVRAGPLRRASKGEALRRLAPSSLHLSPESRRRGFDRLVELIERVPAYAIELGSDLHAISPSVRLVLAEAIKA